MRRRLLCTTIGLVSLLCVGGTVFAHHAFSSEFNANRVLTIQGTISEIFWTNPHVAIKVNVKDAEGRPTVWTVRGDSPSTLMRNGSNGRTFTVGQELLVCGYEAMRGRNEMSGELLSLQNGVRMLFATTDVRACLQGRQASTSSQSRNASPIGRNSPIGPMSNPIGPMSNPIPPMGNPIGPAVATSPSTRP